MNRKIHQNWFNHDGILHLDVWGENDLLVTFGEDRQLVEETVCGKILPAVLWASPEDAAPKCELCFRAQLMIELAE